MSRSTNGNAPIISTLIASTVIVSMHAIFSTLVNRFSFFRRLFEGRPYILISNGKVNQKNMGYANLSENDLHIELRKRTNEDCFKKVKEARLETSGDITFVIKK